MLYGIVDIGSNTVRMNVYRCESEEAVLLYSKKCSAGLISYVEKGILNNEGIDKACSIIQSFKWELNSLNINEYRMFSTASLRNLKNKNEVLQIITQETGIVIDVLSGKEEARLSFLGATNVLKEKDGILIDVGGGSTELVVFKNNKIMDAYSIPVGSLSLFQQYVSCLLPNKEEKIKINKRIKDELNKLQIKLDNDIQFMCGVGGSIRAIEKVLIDLKVYTKNTSIIDIKELKRLENELSGNKKETYEKILKVKPDRIHTIVPGLLIVKEISDFFNVKTIQVSNYGVREGYLYKKVLNLGALYE